ncbi:MAG: pentapeptide repeat-containing protein [Bacteroidetes bacterium]|nr:pentapeptide repeat-containing protein [Bacteroidota bacterium]
MSASIREDQTFTKISAADPVFASRQFEYCKFVSCDLSGADLSNILFIECVFDDCNLSLANMSGAGLQNIRFKNCKLSGVNFSRILDFLLEMHFEGCILDNAVFYKKKNKKAVFRDCSMIETDLTEADLSDCKFDNCNLHRATFDQTILKNADLSTSYNFTIDPDNNDIKKAKFSVHGLPGLLTKYDIKVVN